MSLAERLLLRLGGLLTLLMCAVAPASAADAPGPVLLIATDRLEGSGYTETVLIAVPLRDGSHIGFILNRPTPVKLGTLFPEHVPSRKVVAPVYFGGPILVESLFAVARRAPEGGEVIPLFPGLVLAVDSTAVDRVIETMPNDARYFAGFVAWQSGELDDQIRAGAWEVRPADASAVFRADPGSLWRDLHTGSRGPGRRARAPLVRASFAGGK